MVAVVGDVGIFHDTVVGIAAGGSFAGNLLYPMK